MGLCLAAFLALQPSAPHFSQPRSPRGGPKDPEAQNMLGPNPPPKKVLPRPLAHVNVGCKWPDLSRFFCRAATGWGTWAWRSPSAPSQACDSAEPHRLHPRRFSASSPLWQEKSCSEGREGAFLVSLPQRRRGARTDAGKPDWGPARPSLPRCTLAFPVEPVKQLGGPSHHGLGRGLPP